MIQAVDDSATGPGAVSCPSTGFCAAVDGDGKVLTSTDPLGGHTWTATTVDPGESLVSVSCPSASLCVAVDDAGNAVTSTDPAAGPSAWTTSRIDNDVTTTGAHATLDDVSCPSVSLCVAVDNAGNVVSTANPTGGPSAWSASAVSGATGLAAISCPSKSLCIATGGSTMVVSTSPAAGVQAWAQSPFRYALQRISCTGVSLCVAADQNGDVLTSNDPAGGGPTWKATHVELYGIQAATCSPSSWCFALDGVGNFLLGRQPSLSELLAQPLQSLASPSRAARRIKPLLAHGGYSLKFAAPVPGHLVITWHLRGRHGLVAVARISFTDTRSQTLKVELTRTGTRLLRLDKPLAVAARATFAPASGHAVAVSETFALIP